MRNSTLHYFVNNFHPESEPFLLNLGNDFPENKLTKMDNTEILPSERTIENILNFARSYEVIRTEKAGYVEMNLN